MKRLRILSRLCIYWYDHVIITLFSINIMYYVDWYFYIKQPGLPGTNLTWWMIILDAARFGLLVFCWRFLYHIYKRNLYFFLLAYLVCHTILWYQSNTGFIKWVEFSFFLFPFLEYFVKNWCYFFFKGLIKLISDSMVLLCGMPT